MKYDSIADIYSANRMFRERFAATVNSITPDEGAALPDGEKWSIQQIAEHVAIVNIGIAGICAKMLEKAREDGIPSDGSFTLSETFGAHAAGIGQQKLEAPERVHPTGEVTLAEAMARLEANVEPLDAIRGGLEQFDCSAHTFLHPYFGPLTAGEWLVVAGLHENRHRDQIEKILKEIRQ
ncbi:hypothetical protein BH10ACI3_BH10ACI3_01680 [soil metagenome]